MITPAKIGPSRHDRTNSTHTDPVASSSARNPRSLLELLNTNDRSASKSLLNIFVSSDGRC